MERGVHGRGCVTPPASDPISLLKAGKKFTAQLLNQIGIHHRVPPASPSLLLPNWLVSKKVCNDLTF